MRLPRRDERGATAVILGVMVSLLVVVAAFAVDLGVQRVARRDMQALADVVALDMVRQLDGRTQAVIKATNDWRGGLEDSLRRNLNPGGSAVAITSQQEQRDAVATVAGQPVRVAVRMGLLDPTTGAFTETIPYPDVPNAVRVIASTSVDFAFSSGSGGVSRTAFAQTEANACFSVGSFLASLSKDPDSLIALLNPILGDTDLTVVSYQGLASSDISLLQLSQASAISVGTLEGLLAAEDISVADIFVASAEVLRNEEGAANLANAALLERLAVLSVVGDVTVPIGDLIELTTAGDGALDVDLNLLDLVAGAVTIANGTNFAGLHDFNLAVPNLLNATSSVTVTEAPHLACGRAGALAKTAQARVTVGGTVGTTVSLPLGGTLTIGGPLTLAATIGQATGTLGQVSCAPDTIPISVKTDLATLTQNLTLGISGDDIGLGNSGIPLFPGLLTADISLSQTVFTSLQKPASTAIQLEWKIPASDSYDTVKSTNSGSHTLPSAGVGAATGLRITDIRLAGIPLASLPLLGDLVEDQLVGTVTGLVNALLGPTGLLHTTVAGVVSNTVNPLIGDLNVVVGQLAGALGLDLAGADVAVLPYAKCNAPVLRG